MATVVIDFCLWGKADIDRTWHKADITIVLNHVCFWGKADIDWTMPNVRL
ncbi:MAG: hypothetical protein WA728_00590 [Xanthobacteraceae bacterium]